MKFWVAVLMLSAALVVRLHEIDQPLVRFHPTRHYRSAVIARACYYHAASGIPDHAIRVADANLAMQPAGEPPFMEWLACGSYLALGREAIVIPRIFAILAWIAGAIPVFLIGRRLGSAAGAIIASTLYLFLPYGIVASRNFQPDALMTLASLWALLALLQHYDQPTPARRFTAIGLVALALLIKPMSIFLTAPVLVGLHLARPRPNPWRLADYGSGLVTLLLSLAPATVYYGYGAVFGSFARDQMHFRFVPQLLGSALFWHGLPRMMQRVFTLPLLAVALLGTALARRTPARALLGSLWIGYAAFAVAFTYHMPTHDYYHWPYIAVVALGTGMLVTRVEHAVGDRLSSGIRTGLLTLACLTIAALGSWSAWPRLHVPNAEAALARYREIGELAEHDTRVLFLDTEYGYSMMYHSEVSGDAWPNQDDLAAEALSGDAALDATARFERDYAHTRPRFFVVTDLGSLTAQPDLKALLAARATVVRQTPDYQVYKFSQ